MKKTFLITAFCALLGIIVFSCSQDELDGTTDVSEMKGSLSSDNAELSNYFKTSDFQLMVRSHGLDLGSINLNHVSKQSYDDYYVDSYIIPVGDEDTPKGTMVVCADYKHSQYYAIYMDLSDILISNSSKACVSFSDGTELADYRVTHKENNISFKLDKVYSDKGTEVSCLTRMLPPPQGKESWSNCVRRVFQTASESCAKDPRCHIICATTDIIGGGNCTGSMIAAAAAACALRC